MCDGPGGLLRLRDNPEKGFTHGVDPPIEPTHFHGPPTIGEPDDPVCVEDATDFHTRLIYTVPTDLTSKYTERAELLRDYMRRANGVLINEANDYGVRMEYRILCDQGVMDVDEVRLSTTYAETDWDSLIDDLVDAGHNLPNAKYTIWSEGNDCKGGLGSIWLDTRPGLINDNNGNLPNWGVNWGCTGDYGALVTMHEHGHNMGAVQYSGPPNTSGAGHCNDDADIMCYADGGPTSDYDPYVCTDRQYFDCGHNDYFHPAPPVGNWLHDHWNLGAPYNRFLDTITEIPLRELSLEDFDDGEAQGWRFPLETNQWRITDQCTNASSPPYYLGYHRENACDFDHPLITTSTAIMPVDLRGQILAELRFDHRWVTASDPDPRHQMVIFVPIDGEEIELARWDSTHPNQPDWRPVALDLSSFLNRTFDINFRFSSSGSDNAYPGWFLDDVAIYATNTIPPIAIAGPDQHTTDGDGDGHGTFAVNGTASHDPYDDGTVVRHEWYLGDTLLATGPTPTLTVPAGVNNVTLNVTDDMGGQGIDHVELTVLPNIPPSADAGPDLTFSDTDGDGTAVVSLTGSGSDLDGTVIAYDWRENGTLLASGANVTTPLSVGMHHVVLTVTDDGGGTTNDTVDVIVAPNAPPIANASRTKDASDHDNDGAATVHLDATASVDADGTIAHYAWSDGAGRDATGATATMLLPLGTHDLTLTVTDDGNATDNHTISVTVGPNRAPISDPGPPREAPDTDSDGWAEIHLDGTASTDPDGSLVAYTWYEDGALISTEATTTVSRPLGDHTFTLAVEDDGGLHDEASLVIEVVPNSGPTAAFSATCDGRVCDLDAAPSQDDGTLVSYAWDFGDGNNTTTDTPTTRHTYSVDDVYRICLTVTDASNENDTSCRRTTAVDAIYLADFDDGTAPGMELTHFWHVSDLCAIARTPPTYLGHHKADECKFGEHRNDLGTATFTVDLANVTDPALHFYHRWVAPWSNEIRHRMQVHVSTDGTDWTTLAAWDNRDSYHPEWTEVQIDLSAYAGDSLDIRFWFEPGDWSATWTRPARWDGSGWNIDHVQVDSASSIYIPNHAPDLPRFYHFTTTDHDSEGNGTLTLDAGDASDRDGTIVSFEWLKDGIVIANGQTTNVTLPVGSHVLELVATDDDDANTTRTVTTEVGPNLDPTATAGPDQGAADPDGDGSADIHLDGTASSDPDGTIVHYAWSTDGALIAEGPVADVTLPVGVHTVVLQVTDEGGGTDADSLVVAVEPNEPPAAHATATTPRDSDGDGNEPVTLDGSASTDPDGSLVSYTWSEDNATIATGATATVPFIVGTHDVRLTVTDNGGASTETMIQVTVEPNAAPIPRATASSGAIDADGDGAEAVDLDGTASTDPDGTVTGYTWQRDGTTIATGPTASVPMPVGTHHVELVVVDDGGASNTTTIPVTVEPNRPPVAVAGPDRTASDPDGSGDATVPLDGTASYDPDATALTYEWYRNGTLMATGATTNATVPTGTHTIRLQVTDAGGATGDDTLQVTVGENTPPAAVAGPDHILHDTDGTGHETAQLDGSASSDSDGPVTHAWYLDDTLQAEGAMVQVPVPLGTHTITLVVTDNGGATATDTLEVTVHPNEAPIADAGSDQQRIDEDRDGNETVPLDGSASRDPDGGIVAYTWRLGNDTIATEALANVTLPPGEHTLRLIVADAAGATANDTMNVTILDNRPPIAAFEVTCEEEALCRFDANASVDPDSDPLSYHWSFGDGTNGTGNAPTHTYPHGGRFTPCLTVDDGHMQSDPVCQEVQIITTLLREDFDDGTADDWTLTGLWHIDDECTDAPTGPNYLGYHNAPVVSTGIPALCNYQTTGNSAGSATFTADLRNATLATITYQDRWMTETTTGNVARDVMTLEVRPEGAVAWQTLDAWDSRDPNQPFWRTKTYHLAPIIGTQGEIRFRFDSGGPLYNQYQGWHIDDVRVTSDSGPSGTAPLAHFTASCHGTTCTFDGSTSTGPHPIVAYDWSFGDGTTATGATVTHTYATPGDHTVRLDITDTQGATNTTRQTITVTADTATGVPPTEAPPDPHMPDAQTDLVGDQIPVPWMDIESAWFAHDPGHLYVAMKVADIPSSDRTTSFVAYRVQFTPTWDLTDPTFDGKIPAGEALQRFEARAHLSPVGQPGSPLVTYELWAETQHQTTHRVQWHHVADVEGDLSTSTNIIWWPLERPALGAPTDATLTDPLAMASPSVRGTLNTYGVTGDATGTGRDHTF